jgi:hypothetical protein
MGGTYSGIDPALLDGMNKALEQGGETLRREAGPLRSDCEWWGIGTAELQEIVNIGVWAGDQLPNLRRRQQLAAAIDAKDGKINGGLVRVPDDFLDQAAATAKGKQLAEQVMREMEEDGRLSPETLKALQENGWDPAFAAGFYDKLGPTGLARLSSSLADNPYSDPPFYYRDHPDEAKKVLQALGTGLATYSRDHTLDDAWLDKFALNPDGDDPRGKTYRPDLLAPILAGANGSTFGKDFLEAVGNRILHPKDSSELEWIGGWDQSPSLFEQDHRTQIFRVISQSPLAAGEFYRDNFDDIQKMARTPNGLPFDSVNGNPEGQRGQAIADLVLAGTVGVREYNEALAELNTAHLLYDVYQHKGEHVYPQMETVYGKVVHAWFSDLTYSVTTPVPSGMALVDPKTGNIVGRWNGADFWARSDVNRQGIEVPQELWDAIMQEGMRDPQQAAALGLDFAAYVRGNVHDVSRLNPSDELGTRFLNIENGRMQGFYLHAFQQVSEGLQGDVKRWVEDYNKSVDGLIDTGFKLAPGLVTKPEVTLVELGKSLGTDMLKGVLKEWAHVDAGDAPKELRDRLAAVNASEYDTSWQDNWQQYGEEAYEAWQDKVKPIEPVTIVSGGQSHTYTGNPADYIDVPSHSFLDADGHIMDVSEMTPEQAAAYARWLQDPAVVARILHNGAADQELAKLMK